MLLPVTALKALSVNSQLGALPYPGTATPWSAAHILTGCTTCGTLRLPLAINIDHICSLDNQRITYAAKRTLSRSYNTDSLNTFIYPLGIFRFSILSLAKIQNAKALTIVWPIYLIELWSSCHKRWRGAYALDTTSHFRIYTMDT